MITKARLRDFQSIKDVEIEFGKFTVLVGPSNSGKSAFLRGMKACVRNSSVPANVRLGTKSLSSEIVFGDATVEAKRGKSLSTYVLNGEAFTKSGRSVPEEVEKVLRMPLVEGMDLSFRFQFDKPPLLAESGSTSAQVLGSLTNVSLLHAAAREANRRKLEASSTLKVRQKDLVTLQARVDGFLDLPSRKRALDAAQGLLDDLAEDERLAESLQRSVTSIRRAEEMAAQIEVVEPVDVDDLLDEVAEIQSRATLLETLTKKIRAEVKTALDLSEEAKSLKSQAAYLEEQCALFLAENGCPVCGCADPASHK